MNKALRIAAVPMLLTVFALPEAVAAPTMPAPAAAETATPTPTPTPTPPPASPLTDPSSSPSAIRPNAAPQLNDEGETVTDAAGQAASRQALEAAPEAEPRAAPPAIAAARTPGEIDVRWQELGGAAGWLGAPTAAERAVAGGAIREYANGVLYRSDQTGVRFVRRGPVLDRYRAAGETAAGFPVTDQRAGAGASQVLELPTSRIIWTATTGANWVYGAIFATYLTHGAERGFLGVPTSDELPGNNGGRSRISRFRGGSLIWTPGLGTHELYGAIGERYSAYGREGGALGAPTSGEFDGAPGARVNRFERGLIIWRPETGAWAVHGLMLAEYERHRWERGDLGAPIGNEFVVAGGWGQDFQNGRILFQAGRWRIQPRLNAYVRPATTGDVRLTYRPGCPVGPPNLRVIEMNHLSYQGVVTRGQLIVRDDMVDRTLRAFQAGADGSFPIAQMVNPDVFRADDPAMMRANNTSGFNCRSVVGNPYAQSPHSTGRAIDVNTIQNPYFDGRRWWPENGTRWINRGLRDQGMLFADGPLTRGMTSNGFTWGGAWANRDYQHFQR